MSHKSILVLILLLTFQTIMSCGPCDCPNVKTYEIQYNGVVIKAYDTSGFQPKEVTGSAYRNACGLTASVSSDWNQIAQGVSSFGFVQAFACDCLWDEYIYLDPISYVKISMTDVNSGEISDVSAKFEVYGYDGLLPLDDFFSIREDWHDGFQFELVDFASISDLSEF